MSIKIMQNAWEYSQHKGTCLNILLSLSDHANDRGISWPSLSRLADRSRTSSRNVRRHLRALESTGEIYTIPREGRSSYYLVTIGFSENELVNILRDVLRAPATETKKYVAAIVNKRGYSTNIPNIHSSQNCKNQAGDENLEPGEGGTPTSGVGEDANVRGGGDASVRGGGRQRLGGGTLVPPKPSLNHQLTPKEETSSSSSSTAKGAEDDDEDDLSKLMRAAGISAQNQKKLLKATFDFEDVLAELARCYDPRSNVQKPHVIMPMNLLKGDFPDATCYDSAYWEQHIPDTILHKARVTEYVQGKAQREREKGLTNSQREGRESPIPGGNGKTSMAAFDIPEKYQKGWEMTRNQLQHQIPKVAFDTWVRHIELISTEGDTFILAVKNEYARDWLNSRLKSTLIRLLTGSMGRKVQVNCVVREISGC